MQDDYVDMEENGAEPMEVDDATSYLLPDEEVDATFVACDAHIASLNVAREELPATIDVPFEWPEELSYYKLPDEEVDAFCAAYDAKKMRIDPETNDQSQQSKCKNCLFILNICRQLLWNVLIND